MTDFENFDAVDAAIGAALRQRPAFTPRVDIAHAAMARVSGAARARASQRALAWSHGAWQAISAGAAAAVILIVYCTWSVGLGGVGAFLADITGRGSAYAQAVASTVANHPGAVTATSAVGSPAGSSAWIMAALLLVLLGAGLAWAWLAADDDWHGRFAIR